jgi:hypothetical protein
MVRVMRFDELRSALRAGPRNQLPPLHVDAHIRTRIRPEPLLGRKLGMLRTLRSHPGGVTAPAIATTDPPNVTTPAIPRGCHVEHCTTGNKKKMDGGTGWWAEKALAGPGPPRRRAREDPNNGTRAWNVRCNQDRIGVSHWEIGV